jgi:hypothetical protein
MSWSFVGSNSGQIANSALTGNTPALPAGVQGGDLIILVVSAFASTITQASFTTLRNTSGAASANDNFLLSYRIAAGTPGSATTDPSQWTVTFGTTTWAGGFVYVIRSSLGVGSVANSAEFTNATRNTVLTAPALTVAGSGDATIWGYGGQPSGNGGVSTAITMPGTLSNTATSAGQTWGNGGSFGIGWGVNVTAPGTATAVLALDQNDFGVDVTEAIMLTPGQALRFPPVRFAPLMRKLGPGAPFQQPAGYSNTLVVVPITGTGSATVKKPSASGSGSIPGPLATSTSAKALQRPSADKIAYLFDGSAIIGYWNGTTGQIAQVTNPLTAPVTTNLITTAEDAISIWTDNSSGTSSDIWISSSYDDASGGAGPALHVRHGTYNGSTFTWDTATLIAGTTNAATIQSTIVYNGTYVIVFWWDGISGTDRISYSYTTDKTATTGWATTATFSESATWSTIVQVAARHSTALGGTVVVYGANSQLHYAALSDSSTPALANWGGRTVFDQFSDAGGFGGPQIVINENTGDVHVSRACQNSGGPTWFGVTYWHGTWSAGSPPTMSFATRVIVDSAGSSTAPVDIALAVDVSNKVWVLWTDAVASGNLKYATLVSPFTSASGSTTLVAGGGSSNPRWPHVPAISQTQDRLADALPILYTDTTSSPYPIKLDTTVTLPASGASGSGSVQCKKPSANGSGTEQFSATGAPSAKKPSASGSGTEQFLATGSSLAKKPAAAGIGTNFNGSGSSTVKKMVASGTGTEQFLATGAPRAKKPAANGTGTNFWATGSSSLKKPAASGSGTETFTATGSSNVKKPAAAGTGTNFWGSGSSSVKKPAANGTGVEVFTATGAPRAKKPSASGTGTNFWATGSSAVKKPAASGSGTETFTATGSSNVKKPAANGTGTNFNGSGSSSVKKPAANGTGSIPGISATGSSSVKKPAASGTGVETFTATGSSNVKKPSASGTGTNFYGSGSSALKKPAASGTGVETFTANGSSSIKKTAASGTGTNTPAGLTGTGQITCKKTSVSGAGVEVYTATAAVNAKKPAISGTGSIPGNSATGSATVKKPSASGTGLAGAIGSGSTSVKKPAANGTGVEQFTATGSSRAKKPAANGTGNAGGLAGTGSVTAKKPAPNGTGSESWSGAGGVIVKKATLLATGSQQFLGSGSSRAKKPQISAISLAFGTGTLGVIHPYHAIVAGSGEKGATVTHGAKSHTTVTETDKARGAVSGKSKTSSKVAGET